MLVRIDAVLRVTDAFGFGCWYSDGLRLWPLQFSLRCLACDKQWNTNGFSIHERVTSSTRIKWWMNGLKFECRKGGRGDGGGVVREFGTHSGWVVDVFMCEHWITVHKLMSILKRDPWKSITFNYLEIKPSLKSVSTVILGNLSEKMSFSRVIESTISFPVCPENCVANKCMWYEVGWSRTCFGWITRIAAASVPFCEKDTRSMLRQFTRTWKKKKRKTENRGW